ncbi:MAG: 6-phosphogluconolactonase [Acidimicrobiia bacterium]
MQLTVVEDRTALAEHCADLIAARAAEGRMTLGLAGGSTPAGAYRALGTRSVDWSSVTPWLSDERWVPHDDPDSNGRMALEHLPQGLGSRLIRPRYSPHLQPEDAAAHYEAELRLLHDGRPPDLVLLGMGIDGHTASLFPGTAALEAPPERWFVANPVPQLDTWRLTVTPSLLRQARAVVVLVSGTDKAEVLREVFEGPDGVHPIQLLGQASGTVTFVADRAAADAMSS